MDNILKPASCDVTGLVHEVVMTIHKNLVKAK
jgi:hypothetical protein